MGVKELRLQSESSFKNYCCITAPHLLFGTCHYEVMEWIDDNVGKADYERLCKLLLLPRGHLKAQRLDCKVMTPTGWSTIGQLNVGDQVIGQDGTPKAVTALHPVSKMALWKVRTRDGRETVCNEEHLWNVVCPAKGSKEEQTLPLKDLIAAKEAYYIPLCAPIENHEAGSIEERRAFLQTVLPNLLQGKARLISHVMAAHAVDVIRSLGGSAKAKGSVCYYKLPRSNEKLYTEIVSIERVEDAEARCISVEDEIYITDDYMVTHNSKLMALYVCYRIVKNPAITILYLSASQILVTAQLDDIKSHLTSPIHLRLWPNLVDISKKTEKKWTSKHISVDHPERRRKRIRDNTVSALSIESKFVGLHYDVCVFDDIVDLDNSRTPESRKKLATKVGMITAILNSDAEMVAAGTIYHPQDIYAGWEAMELPVYEGKEVIGTRKRWDVFKKVVEVDGEFLWPRHTRDGRTEGFDMNVLAEKKADILIDEGNLIQFGCQYYMDPMMEGNSIIKRNMFKYYNRRDLKYEGDRWYYRDEPLKTLVGWDFAEGVTKFHDYSVLAVVGLSSANEAYILDLYKYKTQDAAGQFKMLKKAHSKWWFRRVRAEANKAGKQLILEIEKLIKLNGLAIKVDAVTHTSYDGAKEERIGIVLNHRYINGSINHPKGQGYVGDLEDELVSARPRHDDLKDAVATALEDSKPPVHLTKKKLTTTRYTRRGGLVV